MGVYRNAHLYWTAARTLLTKLTSIVCSNCVRACGGGGGGDAILKRKTCMGLRAACMEKGEGAPAYEPLYLTVGGKRASLPLGPRLGQSLSGGGGCL